MIINQFNLVILLLSLQAAQLMYGGQMPVTISPYSEIRSTLAIDTTASTDGFKEISTPIIERIMPLVELYRSKHITVRPVIALTGCSGVGKSHFSDQLLGLLTEKGVKAKILRFDDFNDPEPFDGAIEHIHPHFDGHRAYAFLQKMIEGEELIEKPTWSNNGPKHYKVNETYDLRDVELLIFEGEFTLCDSQTYDFLKFSHLRIILEADEDDIILWDWERARSRETDVLTEFIELRKKSLARYRELLETLKPYADFIIKKEHSHRYVLAGSTSVPALNV